MESIPQKYLYTYCMSYHHNTSGQFAVIGMVCIVMVWLARTLPWNLCPWEMWPGRVENDRKFQSSRCSLTGWQYELWCFLVIFTLLQWQLFQNVELGLCKYFLYMSFKKLEKTENKHEDASRGCWGCDWAFPPFF